MCGKDDMEIAVYNLEECTEKINYLGIIFWACILHVGLLLIGSWSLQLLQVQALIQNQHPSPIGKLK